MIYIKTNLRKIPNKCNDCKFSKYIKVYDEYSYKTQYCRMCIILNKKCPIIKTKSNNFTFSKLPDCPLFEHLN